MAPVRHGHNPRGKPSPTYCCWSNMLQRCRNTKNTRYADYGGRGIKVCDRWSKFENFLADMGERPIGLTIEKSNPNGDYEPDNCCWADKTTQARTKRYGATRKLDEASVRAIRQLRGSDISENIASRFGVTKSVINKIYRGELWAGVGL